MQNIDVIKYFGMVAVFLFLPVLGTAYADSATRDMVSLKLIDKNTQEELRQPSGAPYEAGPVNIRCYGYNWKELDYGYGFDDTRPTDYTPKEIYTITEYYKSEYSLMDWTHYIRFKTIDYCDFEWVTKDQTKFVARKYGNWPVVDDTCQMVASNDNYEIFHIDRVCNMELEVEKVDKFDWENDTSTNEEKCTKTTCPVCPEVNLNTEKKEPTDRPIISNLPQKTGWWRTIRCQIIGWLGGKC